MFEFFKTISHLTQHLFLSRLVKVQHRGGVAVQGGAKLLTHFTNKSFLYLSFLKSHILEDVLPYVEMTYRKFDGVWFIHLGGDAEVPTGSDPSPQTPPLYRRLARFARSP